LALAIKRCVHGNSFTIWLREYFSLAQHEWPEMYLTLWEQQDWHTIIDLNLPGIIVRQAIMRIISTMREAHKGGTIIILPHERRNEFTSRNPLLNIKSDVPGKKIKLVP